MIKKILRYKGISIAFGIGFFCILGATLWVYFVLRNAASVLILHFNNVVGINQIGGVTQLIGVGVTGLVVVIANFLIALELEARDLFLGKLLAAVTLLFAILLFIAFAAIISVN